MRVEELAYMAGIFDGEGMNNKLIKPRLIPAHRALLELVNNNQFYTVGVSASRAFEFMHFGQNFTSLKLCPTG